MKHVIRTSLCVLLCAAASVVLVHAEAVFPSDKGTDGQDEIIRFPTRFDAEKSLAPDGYIGGDGLQFMPGADQSRSHPNIIVAGQDVGGNWLSLDGGRSWWKPEQRGLHTPHIDQVGVDPNNPSRWINQAFDAFAVGLPGKT